jgi:stearoyl-CoA desaturase (delta-9 desaturase)
MQFGLMALPWWGVLLVALTLTHVTIAAVTIFLHRHQAHHALDLHPMVSHFFRFWLWLTTGMVTREWVAIHRKHHVKCETPEDPHSPVIHGIGKVLFEGVELYRAEAGNRATVEEYGRGTPDDWIERKLYARHTVLGIGSMLTLDVVLFGPIGLTIWAVQMLWIPLFAAGVINGIGHYWGYRSFVTRDASNNIVPWGLLIGGEELHNNHHAYSASARLSNKWWEFDIGWMYIRLLALVGMAKVRKVAPRTRTNPAKLCCDAATLQSVILHRYEVLGKFARSLRRTAVAEIGKLRQAHALPAFSGISVRGAIRHWLQRDEVYLPANEQLALQQALQSSQVFRTIYSMRQELLALGVKSTASKEQLVQQLEDWCRRAEESGIRALQEFSRQLRCYDC